MASTTAGPRSPSGTMPLPSPAAFNQQYTVGDNLGTRFKACTRRGTQQQFALKYGLTKPGWEQEVAALRRLGHPHIVALEGAFVGPDQMFLVMERADGGSLFDVLARPVHYSERAASELLHNLLQAVAHMHSAGVVHCDLRPENVLLRRAPPASAGGGGAPAGFCSGLADVKITGR